jgi:hypothetical protein
MQEISYSDVNLGKESEDMGTALGWMNLEQYTFVVCQGNRTLQFCSSLSRYLSFLKSSFLFSSDVFTSFCRCLCNNRNIFVKNLDLSPLTD